jgi:hypothetical protein
MLNFHPLSDLKERPRLAGEPGLYRGLYGRNFGFVNGNGSLAYTNDQKYSRGRENREPISWVEAAKYIPWEEWLFDFFEPVGPTASNLVQREKPFIASTV